MTDARGFRVEMKYDGDGRQSRWIFPSKTTAGLADQGDYKQYGYDPAGNRTSLRKRDGSVLAFQFDSLGRMTVKVVPERPGLAAAHIRDVCREPPGLGLGREERHPAYDPLGRLWEVLGGASGATRLVCEDEALAGE